MDIIIPTYKRVDKQHTFNKMPPQWQAKTSFIVNAEEAKALKRLYKDTGAQFIVHPPEIDSIAKKRAWILKQPQWDSMLMLDDDLVFDAKRDNGVLGPANHDQIDICFRAVRKKLKELVHVGISNRVTNHLAERARLSRSDDKKAIRGWVANKRMMYALGYRASVIRQVCKLGRVEGREDMELTLQLLTKGYPNAVYYDVSVDNYAYNAKGGASEMKDRIEVSNAEALKLEHLFPGLVTLVKRNYTHSVPRWEVVVSWQRAYEQGLKHKRGLLR